MATQDQEILFSINNVRAYQIRHGQEASLTPSGPQTLNLTTSSSERDSITLHLRLDPDVDIPLLATTKVFSRTPRSYMIPPASFSDNVAAFTRIEFADTIAKDDIETFETILTAKTAFGRARVTGTPGGTPASSPARSPRPNVSSERASPAPPAKSATWSSPSSPAASSKSSSNAPAKPPRPGMNRNPTGQIVLFDEEDGSVMGQLGAGAEVFEDSRLSHKSKDSPVEIVISEDGTRVDVREASEDYLREARDPKYANSALVQNAAKASRLLVTSSARFGNFLTSSAENYTQTQKPSDKPLMISPAAQETANKVHAVTKTGATFTKQAVEKITTYTQNMVATLVEETDESGNNKPIMPGWFHEGVAALSTVVDGITEGGKTLISESGNAATMAVSHKYGSDAGQLAATLGGGLRNVGLVYIDVTGTPRRALVSGGKGALLGRIKDRNGNEADLVVGDDAAEKKMITDGKTDEKRITDGKSMADMKLIDDGDAEDFAHTPTRSSTTPRRGYKSPSGLDNDSPYGR